jgi:hypothetical protein
LKKNLGKIGIFILGVVATIIITKMGDKVIPNNNNIIIDKIKDTVFVIEVNRPKTKEIDLKENTKELAKEIRYWKNIAYRSSDRLNNIEKKLNKLELSDVKTTENKIPKIENLDTNKKEIENLKKEFKKLKQKTPETEYISDKGLNNVITKIEDYFPKMSGYSYSGTTTLLELDCPDFNNTEKYIDIDFSIKDKDLLNDISVIFVSMTEINEKGEHFYVYDSYYKPQLGYNHLRVRNVKNRKKMKYKFHYGLMLKSDSNKVNPRVEGINCYFNK